MANKKNLLLIIGAIIRIGVENKLDTSVSLLSSSTGAGPGMSTHYVSHQV